MTKTTLRWPVAVPVEEILMLLAIGAGLLQLAFVSSASSVNSAQVASLSAPARR